MANPEAVNPEINTRRIDIVTLAAFLGIVILGGSNVVAVRISNFGLPPFWGAAFRFASAAFIFWVIVLVRRIEIPKGRRLRGALIYGVLTIGISYAFLYRALVDLPASLATVLLTLGPLFTFLLAWVHKQEAFRWRGLVGAIVAFAGVVIALGTEVGATVPLLPLIFMVLGVAIGSEGAVLFKFYPKSDPMAVNAIALSIGAAILLIISVLFGETWILPASQETWAAFGYLVVGGSVLMFYLFLYVLQRWTASATSYALLLLPLATIVMAAILLDEQVTTRFLLGCVVVIVGVWLGAISQSRG